MIEKLPNLPLETARKLGHLILWAAETAFPPKPEGRVANIEFFGTEEPEDRVA